MARMAARRVGLLGAGVLIAALLAAAGAAGERQWVGGEVRLNLRRGAGTQYKIIGSVRSGEPVEVLEGQEGWRRVRLEGGREGWIPAGYLQSHPPPSARLEALETEVSELREKLLETEQESERLKRENGALSSRDASQRERIARLSSENRRLLADTRWREWLTGASVLAVGMIVGALLHRGATRRRSSRLRF